MAIRIMPRPFLSRRVGDGITYSARAEAFFTRMAADPGTEFKARFDTLVDGMLAWGKLDWLYLFDSPDPLKNIVQDAYNGTLVGGASVSETGGLTTNGVTGGALDTGFNPSSAVGAKFVRDSAMLGWWNKTNPTTTGPGIGGGTSWANWRDGSNRLGFRLNDGTTSNSATNSNTDATGLSIVQREDSGNKRSYRNGSGTALGNHAVASTALANSNFYVMTNNPGTAPQANQCLVAFCGSHLSAAEMADLYSRLNAYLTAGPAL